MHHRVGEFLLRKPEPQDVDALYIQKNDPEVAATLGGFTTGYSRSDLLAWVDFRHKVKDEAFFVIADAADRAVGHVGLYKINSRVGSAEFAILIGDKSLWGKGLGEACSRFMIEYGFGELNLRRIYLEVLEKNTRARSLYEKLGFRTEGQLRQQQFKGGEFLDVLIMGLFQHEYRRDTD